MRPLIGIATSPFKHCWLELPLSSIAPDVLNYFWLLSVLTEKIITSVRDAGAVPLTLTAPAHDEEIECVVREIDGLVFAGGDDITPSLYGEPDRGSVAPDIARDEFELALIKAALKLDKPIFGICRGCQLLNIALGGTLTQNLPDIHEELRIHRRPDVMKGYVHDVKITEPQLFPDFHSEIMHVNSMHHQAIDKLADGAKIAAISTDGVIEAIYAPAHRYVFAVQWHPECLAADDPAQAALFAEIVRRSQNR